MSPEPPVQQKRKADPLSPTVNDVQKRYLLETEDILKNNPYFLLQQSSEQVSDENNILIPQPSTSSQNTPTITTKKERVPPIFVPAFNYNALRKDLQETANHPFTTTSSNDRIKINLTNIEDYRNITKFYTDHGINYYTYQDPTTKPLSVVLKNVPKTLSLDDIKNELESQNFTIIKTTRILNKEKKPTLVVAVDLQNNEEAKEIFAINHLCHAIIKVEPRRYGGGDPQCFRCQRFGHTRNYCKMQYRCVKCIGNHPSTECTKPLDTPPTCTNCHENHPANFRGCKYYVEHKQKSNKTTTYRNNNRFQEHPSIPPVQNYSSNPSRSYANVTRTHQYINQIPEIPSISSPVVEQILNFIINLIAPYMDTIKTYLVNNLLPNLFNNGPK